MRALIQRQSVERLIKIVRRTGEPRLLDAELWAAFEALWARADAVTQALYMHFINDAVTEALQMLIRTVENPPAVGFSEAETHG